MIIPGEDPEALELLTTEYNDHYKPVGPVESAVLQEAIRAEWMRKRYDRIETEVINMRAAAHTETEFVVGAAFEQDATSGNTLQRLFRRQKACDKDWVEAIRFLEDLQRLRKKAEFEERELARELAAREAAKAAAQARPADPRVRFDNGPKPVLQPAPQAGSQPAAPSKQNLRLSPLMRNPIEL